MSKLHELLAVMKDTATTAKEIEAETIATFTKRADHFKGQTRTVTFLDDAREGENGSETKKMVTTVMEKLLYAVKPISKNYDALFQMEATNHTASADLIVDGLTICPNVPATFLLGMETRLKTFRSVLLAMPTLEPAMNWEKDDKAGKYVFKSDMALAFKTERSIEHKIVVEATKEHPAQFVEFSRDTTVARVETVHTSGMISVSEKSAMIGRMDALIYGVKKARQRANCVTVDRRKIAKSMFDYVIG